MKVFVHSRRGLGKSVVEAAYTRGAMTDPAPYGLQVAERPGIEVSYSEDKRPLSGWAKWVFDKLGVDIPHLLENLPAIRQAEVTWAMLEWEWGAVHLAQEIGLAPRRPIVGNSVWIIEHWEQWSRWRRAFWRHLLRRPPDLTLHSQRTLEKARRLFPGKPFELMHFGISTEAFPVTEPRVRVDDGPRRIYAIGTDQTRDWPTLLAAVGNDLACDLRVVCSWLGVEEEDRFSQLEVSRKVSAQDQRDHYQWADIVVVPMIENTFSGITVLLEAAAMGRPIVTSKTGGADTYFGEEEVTFVPPGDAAALREAIVGTPRDMLLEKARRAQARFLSADYSAGGMADRYIERSRKLVGAH